MNICLVNQWPGANINSSFRVIKEAIEYYGFIIQLVDNSENCDIAIDGIPVNKQIVNQESFKIFFMGEPFKGKIDGYDLSLGFEYAPNQPNYLRLPLYYLSFGELITPNFQRISTCNQNKAFLLVS